MRSLDDMKFNIFSSIFLSDKKFSSELWHPYHGHALGEQKPSRDQSEPKLKHHEYRSSTGVPFPPAAGNFRTSDFFVVFHLNNYRA